ncbi:ORF1335 [White spot syndrome virus]|uniref:ORF1335 n=1 Tax=White spot syndrome virus TaxID=342409 RepID=A0A2D3I6N7_9VIRU|nr:ORF1335 [White spot syndrome virus]
MLVGLTEEGLFSSSFSPATTSDEAPPPAAAEVFNFLECWPFFPDKESIIFRFPLTAPFLSTFINMLS